MKKNAFIIALLLLLTAHMNAQTEPKAGTWDTWLIPSVTPYRLPPPPQNNNNDLREVLAAQRRVDSVQQLRIAHWNMGAPSYHWKNMMDEIWMSDALRQGFTAYLLLNVATYDATVAAWDNKYRYQRPRPFASGKKVTTTLPKPESPSYPCEHSVAAGVAVTIIGHFFPHLADSVQRMAQEAMQTRVAAGIAYPSDTKAGFELGQRIAQQEIETTKGYFDNRPWDGKIPNQPGLWKGSFAYLPYAGNSKTIALEKGNQFRPGPPPDFAKDMAELKNHQRTMRSMGNALEFATQSVWEEMLDHKIFEYNWHLNPPRAARAYALAAVGMYDGFIACWDAKYAYWGIRPEQYDTTFQPLLKAPPFPGYPSGHAAIGSVLSEIYSSLFPADEAYFHQRAKEGAESRFQAGIHFRTDNEVALELGQKVGKAVVRKFSDER